MSVHFHSLSAGSRAYHFPSRPNYSHASGHRACPVFPPRAPLTYRPAVRHHPLSTIRFRPHVSPSRHHLRIFIVQFPANNQQCAESLRKANKTRFNCASTRLTAPDLQLSRRHSCRSTTANSGSRSVPDSRRTMDKVARPHGERPLRFFRHTWIRCWPGMFMRIHVFKFCILIFIWQLFSPASVIFAGIGVLLSVCIFDNLVCDIVTQSLSGSQRCWCKPKYSCGRLRAH